MTSALVYTPVRSLTGPIAVAGDFAATTAEELSVGFSTLAAGGLGADLVHDFLLILLTLQPWTSILS